jgi:hypothetical protein
MARKAWAKKKRLIQQARQKNRKRRVAHPERRIKTARPARVFDRWIREVKKIIVRVLPGTAAARWRAGVILIFAAVMMGGLVRPWKRILEEPPLRLWRAYPDAVRGFKQNSKGWEFLLRNGPEIPYSDGLQVTILERMEGADLESILCQAYPFSRVSLPVKPGQEAGRFRNYELLKAAYGATPEEVKKNLVVVDFAGLAVEFNQNNGAAQALHDAAVEIQRDPEAMAYVKRVAGIRLEGARAFKLKRSPNISSWNWRCIEGTRRLSAHSFGIALDLNKTRISKPSYWRWLNPKKYPGGFERVTDLEPVSWPLVEIFEKHGFIWGGKWHHFDTMHFEYRPEFKLMEATGPVHAGGNNAGGGLK